MKCNTNLQTLVSWHFPTMFIKNFIKIKPYQKCPLNKALEKPVTQVTSVPRWWRHLHALPKLEKVCCHLWLARSFSSDNTWSWQRHQQWSHTVCHVYVTYFDHRKQGWFTGSLQVLDEKLDTARDDTGGIYIKYVTQNIQLSNVSLRMCVLSEVLCLCTNVAFCGRLVCQNVWIINNLHSKFH